MALVLIIAGFALLAGLLAWYSPHICYRAVIKRKSARLKPDRGAGEQWLETQPCERVSIVSHDGLKLNAYYLAAGEGASGRDTAIFAHGYMADGRQLGAYARLFWEKLGCNILLPDARGYGYSEGAYTGFGWHDRLDILGWIGWIKKRGENRGPDQNALPIRIILFGLSMGAATMLMVSGENPPPELKLIIEDCGYTSLADEVRHQLQYLYHIPGIFRNWLFRASNDLTGKFAGYRFEEASALNQVKKSKIPTFFIHGGADNYVPTKMAYSLFEACPAEKELYIVPGASHTAARNTDPAEYDKRVAGFVMKYMP